MKPGTKSNDSAGQMAPRRCLNRRSFARKRKQPCAFSAPHTSECKNEIRSTGKVAEQAFSACARACATGLMAPGTSFDIPGLAPGCLDPFRPASGYSGAFPLARNLLLAASGPRTIGRTEMATP
jgi:hypothetical protein